MIKKDLVINVEKIGMLRLQIESLSCSKQTEFWISCTRLDKSK